MQDVLGNQIGALHECGRTWKHLWRAETPTGSGTVSGDTQIIAVFVNGHVGVPRSRLALVRNPAALTRDRLSRQPRWPPTGRRQRPTALFPE